MGATADQVIAQVTPLAGENEAVVGSNNTTVNKYFGVRGVAYCGYTLMYACRKAGSDVLNGCSNAAFVPTLKTYLKNKGWQVSNSSAQKGDIFVYTVPGGTGTHTGFIYERVSGATVITIEGNSTVCASLSTARNHGTGYSEFEGIGYKKRYLDSTFTVYRPAYSGSSSGGGGGGGGGSSTITQHVRTFQSWLNSKYSSGLAVDGEYGPLTRKAAVKAYQKTMNSTYRSGLAVDGIFGSASKAAISRHPLKNGSTGTLVYICQGMLYCHGYDAKGFDGEYGSGCTAAVKSYQKAHGLLADGEAGSDTFYSMMTR